MERLPPREVGWETGQLMPNQLVFKIFLNNERASYNRLLESESVFLQDPRRFLWKLNSEKHGSMIHWQLPVVLSEEQGKENNALGFVMEKCISGHKREYSEKYKYMPKV